MSGNYSIQAGDSLWTIAKNQYGDNLKSDADIANAVNEIASANNLENPDLIYAGDELNLPDLFNESQEIDSSETDSQSALDELNSLDENDISDTEDTQETSAPAMSVSITIGNETNTITLDTSSADKVLDTLGIEIDKDVEIDEEAVKKFADEVKSDAASATDDKTKQADEKEEPKISQEEYNAQAKDLYKGYTDLDSSHSDKLDEAQNEYIADHLESGIPENYEEEIIDLYQQKVNDSGIDKEYDVMQGADVKDEAQYSAQFEKFAQGEILNKDGTEDGMVNAEEYGCDLAHKTYNENKDYLDGGYMTMDEMRNEIGRSYQTGINFINATASDRKNMTAQDLAKYYEILDALNSGVADGKFDILEASEYFEQFKNGEISKQALDWADKFLRSQGRL